MTKKPSNQKLGDYYGLHRNTIANYRNNEAYHRIYAALLAYYLLQR
jgi:hypothetical protein